MNKSKAKKENNIKSNFRTEIHHYKDKKSIINSKGVNSSQNESIENSSEDKFDWDWIFEKGWLRIKK
ncbi:MAG: hypothetical protein ACFFBT_06370 [Promethearchaeota archaeon]